jgi:hypothetical protein
VGHDGEVRDFFLGLSASTHEVILEGKAEQNKRTPSTKNVSIAEGCFEGSSTLRPVA